MPTTANGHRPYNLIIEGFNFPRPRIGRYSKIYNIMWILEWDIKFIALLRDIPHLHKLRV